MEIRSDRPGSADAAEVVGSAAIGGVSRIFSPLLTAETRTGQSCFALSVAVFDASGCAEVGPNDIEFAYRQFSYSNSP
jgi:hypothetical protein